MSSIRTFLLVRLVGGAAVVLALAGLLVYVVAARSLSAQFDENLEDRIQGFASLLFQIEDHVEFEFSGQLMPVYDLGPLPAYFELWRADGSVLERSDSLQGRDLVARDVPRQSGTPWSARLPDGRNGRYLLREVEVHHVSPEEGPKRPRAQRIVIAIAAGTEELESAEHVLLASSLAGALALLALIGIIAWRAVERGLEPAHRLASALSSIQVERLPEKLEVGALPTELVPMARTTDALLARVASALQRERRTTADIAHELRTPIAEILAASEVALRDDRDAEAPARALVTVRDVAARMGRSVSTLLKLSRLEMGSETLAREQVEVVALVREVLRSHGLRKQENRLVLTGASEGSLTVETDPDVLRIVVSNLLGNALYYAPAGAQVGFHMEGDGARWRIRVENEAPNLTPEDLPALGQPFWRKDPSRKDRQRSGLGLALSMALVRKSDLSLEFQLVDGVLRAELTPGHSR